MQLPMKTLSAPMAQTRSARRTPASRIWLAGGEPVEDRDGEVEGHEGDVAQKVAQALAADAGPLEDQVGEAVGRGERGDDPDLVRAGPGGRGQSVFVAQRGHQAPGVADRNSSLGPGISGLAESKNAATWAGLRQGGSLGARF